MKNTTAMADYELRHIEALRKDLAGCTVLLKKDAKAAKQNFILYGMGKVMP